MSEDPKPPFSKVDNFVLLDGVLGPGGGKDSVLLNLDRVVLSAWLPNGHESKQGKPCALILMAGDVRLLWMVDREEWQALCTLLAAAVIVPNSMMPVDPSNN
jgi:hypothetical protein